MANVVQMIGITRRFPGVLANDAVDFELEQGEIHGLLGENGAGKTTLMNILFGLYQPDAGQILVRGTPTLIHSPADAIRQGIGMVHQHFKLAAPFTVTENIILGIKDRQWIDYRQCERQVAELAERYGLKVDPRARIQSLSVGEQQRVEILSSLYRGAEVLILDEPTAVLTPQEAEALADGLRKMAAQGKSIVFISHKLEEVLHLTDRVTVLRLGKVVFKKRTAETDKTELAREMIGRDFTSLQRDQRSVLLRLAGAEASDSTAPRPAAQPEKAAPCTAPVLLEARDLHVRDDRDLPAVNGVSLQVCAGEVLGIAGVDGNGQRELVEALVGLRRPHAGQVRVAGQDATGWTVRDFIRAGLAYIPDDRHNDGLILGFDLSANATLKVFEKPPYAQRGLLVPAAMERFARRLIEQFDVRAPGPQVHAATLSGGNQQKLILARELSQSPRLIVANKPTRGLDIGAAAYVHQKLLEERARGAAVLLISADLDEILLVSDRILVMYNGRSMGILDARQADLHALGLMMAGVDKVESTHD